MNTVNINVTLPSAENDTQFWLSRYKETKARLDEANAFLERRGAMLDEALGYADQLLAEVKRLQAVQAKQADVNLYQQNKIKSLQDQINLLDTTLEDANGNCRSSYSVAAREGVDTGWTAFAARIKASLLRQHKVMYPGQYKDD